MQTPPRLSEKEINKLVEQSFHRDPTNCTRDMIQVIEEPSTADACHCNDAAHWPNPIYGQWIDRAEVHFSEVEFFVGPDGRNDYVLLDKSA